MALALQKTSTLREQILTLLVMVSMALLFYRVLYSPKHQNRMALKTQLQNLTMEKEALEKFTQTLLEKIPEKEIGALSPSLTTKIKILNGEMEPVARETKDLLLQFTTPKILSGIDIKEMNNETGIGSKLPYTEGKFSLLAEGTFGNVTKYLERLEEIPALFIIDNVSITAVTPQAARVHIDLKGSLLALKTEKPT